MSTNDQPLPGLAAPRVVISKRERRLQLFDGNDLVKTYRIALGFMPVGDKIGEGDGRTPEGDFYIFTKNPKSRYHLSLALSYPNINAAERGLQSGLISQEEHDAIVDAVREQKKPPQKTRLGGEIYIHGGGAEDDWTRGCIAIADQDIEELFNAAAVGTPVRIEP